VIAWRLLKTRHLANAFTGEGARAYGGRWNGPGTRVVYCAEHVSLAVLEVLVHLEHSAPLRAYSLIRVDVPDAGIEWLARETLPATWNAYPAPPATRRIGDAWVASRRSLALAVPSVLVPGEHNFLLNPAHPDFRRVSRKKPRPFLFDARLL
jgi:RES domain-containing protein